LPPLGHVEWLSDASAAEEMELSFTEIAADLVLQLRRAEDGRAEGDVLGEVCLPLARLAAAAASAPSARSLSAAPLGEPSWYELLLPCEHGLQRPRPRPEKGAPGWLLLSVTVTLARHERVAYASLPYEPHPARNLWHPKRPAHPELGVVSAVMNVPQTIERVATAAQQLALGCAAAPLRTACFLQTWRAPRLNACFVLLAYAFTTRTAFRLGAPGPHATCGHGNPTRSHVCTRACRPPARRRHLVAAVGVVLDVLERLRHVRAARAGAAQAGVGRAAAVAPRRGGRRKRAAQRAWRDHGRRHRRLDEQRRRAAWRAGCGAPVSNLVDPRA
jgi:hypothetical protein